MRACKRFAAFASVVVMVTLGGCGGDSRYVAVSGTVKVDGKAYKNAIVTFVPQASASNPNPGRTSSGITDDNGHFVLKTDEGVAGAVAGKHMVRIATKSDGSTLAGWDYQTRGSPDSGDQKGAKIPAFIEVIPPEWNSNSSKDFEVPAGGTDQANFDIVSHRKK